MKRLLPVLALGLAAGCTQMGGGAADTARAPGNGVPSRFQSIAACEPTQWAALERQARRLPDQQRVQVRELLNQAQGYRADGDRLHCLFALQRAEEIVALAGAQ